MSSLSRMDMVRKREEAQRRRANQALVANRSQSDDIPEEPLFDEPRKIGQSDKSAQHIKKIFGEWTDLKWVSGMPIRTGSSTQHGVDSQSGSSHQPRVNGEHRHPPYTSMTRPEARQDAPSRDHSSSSSASRGHTEMGRPRVDDRHRASPHEHTGGSSHRPHPGVGGASGASSHSHSLHGTPNHVRESSHLMASHASGVPRSLSPSKQHASVVQGHGKPRTSSPAVTSSHDRQSDVNSINAIIAKTAVPSGHSLSSAADSHRRHHSTHPVVGRPGVSDHGRSDRRNNASRPKSVTPPPGHRTPPPAHGTPPPPHCTPPPVHRSTPPPVHRSTPPPQLAVHRTPPPSRHQTPPVSSGDAGHSPSGAGQTKPKHLTLQIQKEPVDFKDLNNIFEEMTVPALHTAIQTPVKGNVNRFPFPTKSTQEDKDDEKQKSEASTEKDTIDFKRTEEPLPTPEERNSVLEDDLAVSDSENEEEEEAEKPAESKPQPESTALEKKPDSYMSSSNETSSEESSTSDDTSSETSDSSSEDDNNDEEEEKDEDETEIKKEEVEENSQNVWNLKNFMVARPSPPVQPLSSSQPSADNTLVKPCSPADMKVSPRKMAEIGPCNSMPFMPHEDIDLRNSEKASLSPDAPSTASSTASTHANKTKCRPLPSVKVRVDVTSQDSEKKENIESGPGRPKLAASSRGSICGTPTKRKGSVRDKDETSSVGSTERKRKRRDSGSSVKAKESKPARVGTPSSGDDVDVESVTPDPRTSQSTVLTKDEVLEGLGSVSKQLFLSPLSSPQHQPEQAMTTKMATPTKSKPPRRQETESEKGCKQESGSVGPKVSSRKKSGAGSSSHIDSIMAEMKEEFKLPALLSPTEPHRSPSLHDRDDHLDFAFGRVEHIPTATCGRPSIVVRITPSKLRNGSRVGAVCRTTDTKREAVAPTVLSNSVSVGKSAASTGADADSLQPGACNKNPVDHLSSPLPAHSSPSSRISPKQKKETMKTEKPTKKQKSAKAAPKASNQHTTENLQNGISHTEVKKVSKRVSERRSSSSSSRSSSSKKPKKDSQSAKSQPTEVPQQNGLDAALPFNSYSSGHGSPTPSHHPSSAPNSNEAQKEPVNDPLMPAEDRLEQPDFYLLRAKELKHIADKAEKPAKLVPYVKSILYFILWGYSQEHQNQMEPSRVFSLYGDTCQLLQFVSRFRNLSAGTTSQEAALAERDRKLSVLILRMLALLNLKLFSLKKVEVMKFKKIIEHEYKNPSFKMSAHAPSPHQNNWNKNSTGTPSPMSPTPSPTCSIGSVGSQGSCEQSSNKPLNGSMSGSASALSSPAGTVPVPQRIHSVTQKYMASTAYLVQAHDLWEQSDTEAYAIKEFFSNLDNRCGPLSLHSSMLQLVCYVNSALKEMGCS